MNKILIRLLDLFVSSVGIIICFPIILISCFIILLQDFNNPFYVANRIGLNNKSFKMFKLRSMIKDAEKTGVDSTSSDDIRITKIGKIIRKFKIDEVPQLINVFLGEMSLVGPRPNVYRETKQYTIEEKKLLTVLPGITDIASIVFSDENDILRGTKDPDLKYNQLIRPGKNYLALFYIQNKSFVLNIYIIYLTILSFLDRGRSLDKIAMLLEKKQTPKFIIDIASRKYKLNSLPPPGSKKIVKKRN